MHNIIKNPQQVNIDNYIYDDKFASFFDTKDDNVDEDVMETLIDPVEISNNEAHIILQKAQEEAFEILNKAKNTANIIKESILEEANNEATKIRELAVSKGYEIGYQDGFNESIRKNDIEFTKKLDEILEKTADEIRRIESVEDTITKMHYSDLTDLAINIASKIINVSLKASSEVIEKMIISAIEKSKNVQWVKIYIASCDSEYVLKSDKKILNQLKHITDTIKIEILENKESGTCIVEFPDQIIDASVATQLDNIRNLLHGN